MTSFRDEFRALPQRFGAAWNRFWFAPGDPLVLCALRAATGVVTLYVLFTFSPDIQTFFAAGGLLPAEAVAAWAREHASPGFPTLDRFSYLTYVTNPSVLMALHVAGLGVLLTFTVGLFTRVTSILSLVVVLSYMHRAPMLVSQVEPIVAMVLFYLCLAPCGACLSIDAWWRNQRSSNSQEASPASPLTPAVPPAGKGNPLSPWATVATRLLQIHVATLYVMIALGQLAGGASSPWWSGQAVWMLVARPDMPLVNLTWLAGHPFLIDLWTRFILCVELGFPLLVWHRPLRPFVLAVAAFMWAGLALITGLTTFCLMVIVASLAFVPPQWVRTWWASRASSKEIETGLPVALAGPPRSAPHGSDERERSSHKSGKARQPARTR